MWPRVALLSLEREWKAEQTRGASLGRRVRRLRSEDTDRSPGVGDGGRSRRLCGAYAQIHEARLERLAGQASETASHLRSLRRIAAHAGGEELTPDIYRAARKELLAFGEHIHEFNQISRFFGSWRQAKEALALSALSTPLAIQQRLRSRLVGKVHRYREDTLRKTLEGCVADLGRLPLVIEFELWRQKQIELAKAQGKDLFLPSDSPYRRRWGGWPQALAHFGYDTAEIERRLEPGREQALTTLAPYQYRADA